ncbi:tRNA-splicing endonuclease subunit Sen15, partial [Geopyxis carbonaria]
LLRTVYANLVHQSDWKSVTIHTHGAHPLPRPMLCGVPAEPVMPGAAGAEEQREWVLPVGLGEKWSLRKGAEVFDALPEGFWGVEEGGGQAGEKKGRLRGKRIVMAIVGGDSTVVYYIMHEGIVKPRQN